MVLMISKFYEEKEKYIEKERLLQESIVAAQLLIEENEQEYKVLLREGKESEADKLFEEQQAIKLKNSSNVKKLSELKPIHRELLQEKALSVLDTDLHTLMDEQTKEVLKIVQEEKDLNKRLLDLQKERMNKQFEINDLFNEYGHLAEEMNLKETYRARFRQEPYNFLSDPGSRAINAAQKLVK